MHSIRRVLFFAIAIPVVVLVSGSTFFFYRDNFSTHFPIKSVSAAVFRSGELPWWNFYVGGGQPLAGNPNTLTFYPDNLLYLIAPDVVAFNLHFILHLAVAFAAMRALVRQFGGSERAAATGAGLYLISGISISALAFYNLVTAVALVPLAFLCAERLASAPGWLRAFQLGAVLGLIGLTGEPVTIVATGLCLVILTFRRLSARLVATSLAALLVAFLVTSPLLIAFEEIGRETERAGHSYSAATVLSASMNPLRALELVIGPFRGLPTDYSERGYPTRSGQWPPLFHSLFVGALLVPALFSRSAPRRVLLVFAVMLFLALGEFNPLVTRLVEAVESLRKIRYPEKFALPLCVAGSLLIAHWLDDLELDRRSRAAALAMFPLFIAGAVVLLGMHYPPAVLQRYTVGALFALATISIPLRVSRSPLRNVLLVGMTAAPMLFWAVKGAPVDLRDPYFRNLPAGNEARVFRWTGGESLHFATPDAKSRYRAAASIPDPVFGAASRLRYVGDRSPEGMYSLLSRIVQERLSAAPLDLRLRYLRMLSCDRILSLSPIDSSLLTLDRLSQSDGNRIYQYLVTARLPWATAVRSATPVRSIQEAVSRIEGQNFDEQLETIVPNRRGGVPTGKARIESVVRGSQTVTIVVSAQSAATLLINESYFSAWQAKVHEVLLPIIPLNIDRLGVIVPAGQSTIALSFGHHRRIVEASLLLSFLLLAACAMVSILESSRAIAAPAR